MKELTLTELEQKKFKFFELPEEIINELSDKISPLLTPKTYNNFLHGEMTIMDWKYKFDMLIDILN